MDLRKYSMQIKNCHCENILILYCSTYGNWEVIYEEEKISSLNVGQFGYAGFIEKLLKNCRICSDAGKRCLHLADPDNQSFKLRILALLPHLQRSLVWKRQAAIFHEAENNRKNNCDRLFQLADSSFTIMLKRLVYYMDKV
jgi:hypothetical protein